MRQWWIFKMVFFIAHKVSGEDKEKLEAEMKSFCIALKKSGYDYYCSFLDNEMRNERSKEELINNAFKKIDELDGVLAIIKSEDKSEGMLIELGYAVAKGKKVVLLIKKNIKSDFIRAIANQIIEFNNLEDTYNKLGEIK